MARQKYLTAPLPTTELPKGIPYIIGNEAAERFSFYGMKAILAVFMTQHLLNSAGAPENMDEDQTKFWIHNFVTAVYFFPIVGAIVSDWLFGKYRTILALSLVYCAGHATLALIDIPIGIRLEPRDILMWGLILISIGAGGIKPCVSAHVGDQFGKQNHFRLSRVFGWFYFSINLGAMCSTILTPLLLEEFGPGWAFGVPGVLMALATFAFWMGRKVFVHIPPAGNHFFTETFSRNGLRAVANLIPLYVFIAMFWALFDQTASAWVLQAEHMDRTIFGYEVLSSQIQAANPFLVMFLIPVFAYGVYPFLNRFFEVTPLRKIGIGLFITVIAFAVPAWIEMRIGAGEAPHIIWQLIAYVVLTAAEVMVSITALEFSYTQAPRKMKSFIMGLYLLSVAMGNQFTAQVNKFIIDQKEQGVTLLEGANYYWFFTGAMAVTAVVYVVYSQFYRGGTYLQEDGTDDKQDQPPLAEGEHACPMCGKPVPAGTEVCHHCGEEITAEFVHVS